VHGCGHASRQTIPTQTTTPRRSPAGGARPAPEARSLYHRGWQLTQIAAELGVKYGTLAAWKSRDGWDEDAPIAVVEDRLEARIATLLDKEPFTEGDMKRVDFMMRQMERAARIRKFDKTGREGDLNPKIAKRNDEEAKAKRADKRKNFLARTVAGPARRLPRPQLRLSGTVVGPPRRAHAQDPQEPPDRRDMVFRARGAGQDCRGVLAGEQPRNQIFLSASQRQANKFRREIVGWVKRVTGVELKGNPIMLDFAGLAEDGPALDGVGLYPLSTNSNTAQGESGDFYFDEFFWVHGFAQLRKVAAAMATHTIYKRTYFPRHRPRPTKPMRSGRARSGTRAAAANSSSRSMCRSATCAGAPHARRRLAADRHARRCHRRRCGRADRREELRQESSDEEFSNLYDCEFIDDSESSFPSRASPRRASTASTAGAISARADRDPWRAAVRRKPVWLGYDPNKQGRDDAALAVVAPPESRAASFACSRRSGSTGGTLPGRPRRSARLPALSRHRHLDRHHRAWPGRVGAGVQVVPARAQDRIFGRQQDRAGDQGQNVFRAGRIEFDAGWTDVMQAFMAIRPTLTGSQRGVTYTARATARSAMPTSPGRSSTPFPTNRSTRAPMPRAGRARALPQLTGPMMTQPSATDLVQPISPRNGQHARRRCSASATRKACSIAANWPVFRDLAQRALVRAAPADGAPVADLQHVALSPQRHRLKNLLVAQQTPTRWLGEVFERWALDFLQMGNAYLEWVPNPGGRWRASRTARRSTPAPGSNRACSGGPTARAGRSMPMRRARCSSSAARRGAGGLWLPEWLSALQSGLLSENATLFRRRYYLNGAHAGFVFYVSEPLADQATVDAIEEQAAPRASATSRTCWSTSPRGRRTASRSCRSPT
jgi:uncharacterized protein YjcR